MYKEDEDNEASLNRQTLNNYVKSKVLERLCERPRKMIHEQAVHSHLYRQTEC
jgi:hypothetical protein